jgi:DNA (cytosine-5)-methyltransferase 1
LCQDISFAGKGAGLAGKRSGLWFEFARVVRTLEPRYVLVENVAALLTRGLDAVLGTLASLGYDAEWHCLQAADVGAPHLRDRVFVFAWLADADGKGQLQPKRIVGEVWRRPQFGCPESLRRFRESVGRVQWEYDPADLPESGVGRVVGRVAHRVDRLRGLGNIVVPQLAEWLGQRIVEFDSKLKGGA